MQIGVIADTHGLLRPAAMVALAGSDLILHAGDIGAPTVLDGLSTLAHVVAVRGNIDSGAWAQEVPETWEAVVEGVHVYLLHDRKALTFDPAAAGIGVVISGHSHQAQVETRNGVLYLNPGSAGPRRFRLPITLARLILSSTGATAEILSLEQRDG
jgi:uncharacterized protein